METEDDCKSGCAEGQKWRVILRPRDVREVNHHRVVKGMSRGGCTGLENNGSSPESVYSL